MCIPSIAPTVWESPACFKICYDTLQMVTGGKAHIPKEEMCCYCVAGFNDCGANGGASYAKQL